MIAKYLFSMLINSCLCLAVTILPLDKELVINEGDKLEITCTASEDIDFFYPKDYFQYAVTSPINISRKGTESVLKRSKTIFGDTGWYGCIESSKNLQKLNLRDILVTPYNFVEIDIKWIYVYVTSEIHTLTIDEPRFHIKGTIGSDVIMPCRPTSPEYKVTLSNIDNEVVTYDPKVGFIFHNMTFAFKSWMCETTKPHANRVEFHGMILRKLFLITIGPSEMHSASIYSDSLRQMTIGQDFSMNCSSYDFEHLPENIFYWITPSRRPLITRFIKDEEPDITDYYTYHSELMIRNVTIDDVGEYKCYFYGDEIQTTKAYLLLHDREYLNVSIRNIVEIMVPGGYFMKYTLYVDAYPLPTFKWQDPAGNEVDNDWQAKNYDLNGESYDVELGKNFTLTDQGNHTLIVTHTTGTTTYNFLVNVIVKPTIIGKGIITKWVNMKKNSIVRRSCKANGYELPTISWEYTGMFQNLTEDSPESALYKVQSTVIEREKKSEIEFKVLEDGMLICHACNQFGCDFTTMNLIRVLRDS